MPFDLNHHISTLLEKYLQIFPTEKDNFTILQKQLANNEDLGTRKNFNGHITGDAYILSPDKKQVLLIHHNNLDMRLAPGGHWESSDQEIHNSALREAKEETGLENLELLNRQQNGDIIPFDINTHVIPANDKKNESDHYHHGFRYLMIATDTNTAMQTEEIKGLKWVDLDGPENIIINSIILEKIRKVL